MVTGSRLLPVLFDEPLPPLVSVDGALAYALVGYNAFGAYDRPTMGSVRVSGEELEAKVACGLWWYVNRGVVETSCVLAIECCRDG